MIYVVSAFAAIYGALSIVAGISGTRQGNKGDTSAMMILGGSAVIAAAVLCAFFEAGYDWFTALCGCTIISLAALINGKRGEFHSKHHIIRAIIEILLVIMLLIV